MLIAGRILVSITVWSPGLCPCCLWESDPCRCSGGEANADQLLRPPPPLPRPPPLAACGRPITSSPPPLIRVPSQGPSQGPLRYRASLNDGLPNMIVKLKTVAALRMVHWCITPALYTAIQSRHIPRALFLVCVFCVKATLKDQTIVVSNGKISVILLLRQYQDGVLVVVSVWEISGTWVLGRSLALCLFSPV